MSIFFALVGSAHPQQEMVHWALKKKTCRQSHATTIQLFFWISLCFHHDTSPPMPPPPSTMSASLGCVHATNGGGRGEAKLEPSMIQVTQLSTHPPTHPPTEAPTPMRRGLGGPKAEEAPTLMRRGPWWSQSEGGPHTDAAGALVAGGGKLCDETENQNMRNYAKNMRKYAKNMQQNMRSFFLANS